MIKFLVITTLLEMLGKLTLKLAPWVMGKIHLMKNPAKFKRGDVITSIRISGVRGMHWRVLKVSPAKLEYQIALVADEDNIRWESIGYTDATFDLVEFYDSPLAAVMREEKND